MDDEQTKRLTEELIADGGEDLASRRSSLKAPRSLGRDETENLVDDLIATGGVDLAGRSSKPGRSEK